MAKRVLVVDDDPVVRVLVSEFLGSHGYQVEVLDSGSACLRTIEACQPDVLVLDMLMPDMTGIEVLKSIRSNPNISKVAVVMLSADNETESLLLSNNVQADCYLRKPFGMQEILGAVEQIRSPS